MKSRWFIYFFIAASFRVIQAYAESTPNLPSNMPGTEPGPQAKSSNNDSASNFLTKPPAWLVYIPIGMSLASGIWILNKRRMDRLDKRLETENSINNEYWFKSIIMPVCVGPFIGFTVERSGELTSLSKKHKNQDLPDRDKDYADFRVKFNDEINTLITRFMILIPIDKTLYGVISRQLEKLEDNISMYCYVNSSQGASERQQEKYSNPEKILFSALNGVLKAIVETQKRINT